MRIIRTCTLIRENISYNIRLAVDDVNSKEIINYINRDARHEKKFNFIASAILSKTAKSELFRKEHVINVHKSVYAMRFFPGQENDRIYCIKIESGNSTLIVMSELMERKKNQELRQRERNVIKRISKYEYEVTQ